MTQINTISHFYASFSHSKFFHSGKPLQDWFSGKKVGFDVDGHENDVNNLWISKYYE
ncbi:MAG: hypothetical protein RIQ50_131 [Bacteroidota bacterium]|jgi:hypothetical protein